MKIATLYLSALLSITVSFGSIDSKTTKLQVLATNSIIGDWVKEVAEDQVDLIVMIGPDTDNHTYEPTPQDSVRLTKADIIFENGLGLEYWLNALYKSSKSRAKRIALSEGLPDLLPIDCHGHFKCRHTHHQEYDPHTWLNPNYVIDMVQKITDALISEDPQNADFYKKKGLHYIDELKKLDSWIKIRIAGTKEIAGIPVANRKLITNHNSFRYFARQYGFIPLGDILGSTSTESVDPSAQQFENLVKIIHKNKVPAIFGETIQNNALINNLAQEAKLPQPTILYTEALSKKNGPAENYIELMKYNVNILVEGLKEDLKQ